jgi:hypothetical protein
MMRRLERSEWFTNRKLMLGHERDVIGWYRGCRQFRTGWFDFGQDFVGKLDHYATEFFSFDPHYETGVMDKMVRDIKVASKRGLYGVVDWFDHNLTEMVSGATYSGRLQFASGVCAAFSATSTSS